MDRTQANGLHDALLHPHSELTLLSHDFSMRQVGDRDRLGERTGMGGEGEGRFVGPQEQHFIKFPHSFALEFVNEVDISCATGNAG